MKRNKSHSGGPVLFEGLENRELFALATTVEIHDGSMFIQGGSSAEQITVSTAQPGQISVKFQKTAVPYFSKTYSSAGVWRIYVDAGGGNDVITLSGGAPKPLNNYSVDAPVFSVNAGEGNDTVNGSSTFDHIFGFGGDDVIYGRGGDDQISGGLGNNTLNGDAGNDRIWGSDNADNLSGGDGDDYLAAGAGDDNLNGGNNDDTLIGGAGRDFMMGLGGNDVLDSRDGVSGNDSLFGGSHADDPYGGYDRAYVDDQDWRWGIDERLF